MFKFLARVAYTIAVVIQSLITIRFVVLLFNLGQENFIIKWIMENSNTFVSPFNGVLSNPVLTINGFKADLTCIVAWFFYLIAGFIAIEIVKAFSTD